MPYHGWCDCFEQCALVLLSIVVSFSSLMSNWKIHFPLITSGLVQMLHKYYLLIIPASLLMGIQSDWPVQASKRQSVKIEFVCLRVHLVCFLPLQRWMPNYSPCVPSWQKNNNQKCHPGVCKLGRSHDMFPGRSHDQSSWLFKIKKKKKIL